MIDKASYLDYKDQGFTIVPMVREIRIDDEGPISIYIKASTQKNKNSFLLESAEGRDKWAQFSIIGWDCIDTIKVYGNEIQTMQGSEKASFSSDDPLKDIRNIINKEHALDIGNVPFYGGYVGFFSYESAQYAEKRIANLSTKAPKFKEHMPDILLVRADNLIVYDNFNHTIQIIFNVNPQSTPYEDIQPHLDEIEDFLRAPINKPEDLFNTPSGEFSFTSNFDKSDYLRAVERIKEYIQNGDVMQVVLAQDFSSEFNYDPFKLYRAIRKLNPSPYMYFLDLEECKVVGASPEILVRLQDDEITLRPIAGTRKRGRDSYQDNQYEDNLINDEKELAEHLMLIDLGRNDVGRVSKFGSVKVTDKMTVEKYSHVMHIVSNIVGTLVDDADYLDVLKATLPAGTLSGAPKIRAMEIINELEPSSRGIYGGAIGYIAWNGNMDTAIAIRTAVIKDGIIHVGAGGGIVADSTPDNEWEECKQKSKVFEDAIEMIK